MPHAMTGCRKGWLNQALCCFQSCCILLSVFAKLTLIFCVLSWRIVVRNLVALRQTVLANMSTWPCTVLGWGRGGGGAASSFLPGLQFCNRGIHVAELFFWNSTVDTFQRPGPQKHSAGTAPGRNNNQLSSDSVMGGLENYLPWSRLSQHRDGFKTAQFA